MTYKKRIRELSFFKRMKIRKDLKSIMKEEGFKRRAREFRYPFTELYRIDDLTAKIYSTIEEHGFEPYIYPAIGLELHGSSENPIFKRTMEKLNTYYDEQDSSKNRK